MCVCMCVWRRRGEGTWVSAWRLADVLALPPLAAFVAGYLGAGAFRKKEANPPDDVKVDDGSVDGLLFAKNPAAGCAQPFLGFFLALPRAASSGSGRTSGSYRAVCTRFREGRPVDSGASSRVGRIWDFRWACVRVCVCVCV